VEVLRDHRLRQLRERTLLGMVAQQPDDLVFAGLEGEPLHPLLFTHAFNRRVKESGVPRIRLHDCRHTAATLMLASGINPKVVAERLGHTSVSITLDLYSHSVPALQREAASKLAAMVLGSPVNKSVNKPAREKAF
jgi:integrase